MVYILGVGAAFPDNRLKREDLESVCGLLQPHERLILDRVGTVECASTVSLEYVKGAVSDPLEAQRAATETPTDLAFRAAGHALARAGITIEQVGLIIGDCVTPYQTCPSEGQRLGGKFGVKIPAYDVCGGPAAFALTIEMLGSWKPERMPDYILCFSSNTPTHLVKYEAGGIEPYLFGDGASAMVVSPRIPGKMKVADTYLKKTTAQRPVIEASRTISLHAGFMLPDKEVYQTLEASIARFEERDGIDRKKVYCIGPELYAGETAREVRDLGMDPARHVSSTLKYGYSLGAAPVAALAEVWDGLGADDTVAVVHTGDGVWSGSLLCTCQEGRQ